MAIKIPVSAQFDAADLQQQIKMVNDQIRILASQVGNANKQKWEPINLKSKDDLQGFIKQMDLLMKKQTDFAAKMKQTGQGGNPLFADFKKMAEGRLGEQIKYMESVLGWAGVEFSNLPAPKPPKKPPVVPPAPPSPPNGGTPAVPPTPASGGGTTRMSAGAGAGLAGLMGGIVAMGISKVVGEIVERVGQAQQNAIGMGDLYRRTGGMMTYNGLRGTTYGAADRLGMTHNEAIGMATTYARAANLGPGKSLNEGMLVSGGLARQFGLDMNATAATIGSMRGNNTIGSDQQLRRMGAVMGEAIGKSGAFARADDVMSSIAEFASAQAQETANAPDLARYAGALSSLAGENLPGMDVRSSAALLGRANSALMSGGAAGAPGQMLMASLGNKYHLTPAQLRVWQENGMFGTLSGSLGEGSMYANTTGRAGPGGNTPLFQAVSSTIGGRYKPGSDEYYQALSRFFGINYSQAMTLSRMNTNGTLNGASGLMSRNGINGEKMDAGTLGIMGQIASGKGLRGMINGYMNDPRLSAGDRASLSNALEGSSGSKLQDALARIAAKYGAEQTEGDKTRNSITQVENAITSLADKAVPPLNIMRMAMMKLVGGDTGMSEAQLRQQYINTESDAARKRIVAKYEPSRQAALRQEQDAYTKYGAFGGGEEKAAAQKRQSDISRQIEIETAAERARITRDATGTNIAASANRIEVGQSAALDSLEASNGASGPASGNWAGNNVGNVRDIHGNFMRFRTQGGGVAESAARFLRYNTGAFQGGKAGRKTTLREMIATYAPPKENDTDGYVAFVARRTGINPDAPIDARDPNILRAITGSALIMENSKNRNLDPRIIDQGVDAALANKANYTADRGPIDINTNHQVEVVLQHPDGGRQRVQTRFKQAHQWGGR